MNAFEALGLQHAHCIGDAAAPVATLYLPLFLAKFTHESLKCNGYVEGIHTFLFWCAREALPRKAGSYHVDMLAEQWYHFRELSDAAWPAVQEQPGVFLVSVHMLVDDVQPIHATDEQTNVLHFLYLALPVE